MAALWEVKQHSVVHLAVHINDSSELCVCESACVCAMRSDCVAYHWAFLCVKCFSHSHAQRRQQSVCSRKCASENCTLRGHTSVCSARERSRRSELRVCLCTIWGVRYQVGVRGTESCTEQRVCLICPLSWWGLSIARDSDTTTNNSTESESCNKYRLFNLTTETKINSFWKVKGKNCGETRQQAMCCVKINNKYNKTRLNCWLTNNRSQNHFK